MIYGNVYAEGRSNNSLFATEDGVHKFNSTYFPRLLRDGFLSRGIEINTPDLNAGKNISFHLYLEASNLIRDKLPKYLIALENPYINQLNCDVEYCTNFDQIFAWDERIFNLQNVTPILIPHSLPKYYFNKFSDRKIFSCLINANKSFKNSLSSDLYLERIKTIRWYEKNAIDKFHLYGVGWDKSPPAFSASGKIKRMIPRLREVLFGYKAFPSLVGEIRDKADVLQNAKYSYCYENSKGLNNYVTEKIFDSLVCGCVPIYWGASNINDLIPQECYIDRSSFKDTAAVHSYLLSISAERYSQYQTAIDDFLRGETVQKFNAKKIADAIIGSIASDVQKN